MQTQGQVSIQMLFVALETADKLNVGNEPESGTFQLAINGGEHFAVGYVSREQLLELGRQIGALLKASGG